MSFMLVAPSAIATAMLTSATPRSTSGNFPARASADPSAAVSPAWSAQLAQQHRPGMPDQPVSLSGDPQPVIPRRILHRGERSCPWKLQACRNLAISQNRGALRC
jgi:hypothetical protein